MATVPTKRKSEGFDYPTSDGRPMSETDFHYEAITEFREVLKAYFANEPDVYVSGNLLLFYERGNRRKHVSPDVFVVKGVAKHQRPNYLLWEEGKGPDVVIEITSKSTRKEDLVKKYELYRDVLRVSEYFLFDPLAEYLKPPLQGFRLKKGEYEPIKPVKGRFPSKVLGLHLERNGRELRLYQPEKDQWLPTIEEALEFTRAKEAEATRAMRLAEEAVEREVRERRRVEAEKEALQRELENLRRRLEKGN